MNQNNLKFLEDSFKKYYFEHFDEIHVPERTSEREFGFQKFNSGMTRHISLKDDKELHLLLMKNIPSDIYCSNAYYSFPNLPMNEKNWKEADLIFDIDSKDLNYECRLNHTISRCSSCNTIFVQHNQCPKCSSTKLEKASLPCKNCIEGSKNEVKKLLAILVEDFAIDQNNIEIYFSGNEGFHVYVYNSQFQDIGSRERSEIVDYILFNGVIPETFGMKRSMQTRNSFPDFDEKGWRGRFANEVFSSKSKRAKLISEFVTNPDGYTSFQKLLSDISNKIGVKIDPNVTMDIHRIFRLPGSINSKSGLAKIYCKNITKFEPYKEAPLLAEDTVEITANCPIEFRLKNKKFGPYIGEKATVPTYAAAYMVCKNLAIISDFPI